MNLDILQGQWQQLRGTIKENFGKLTDNDLIQAEGSGEKMLDVLQARYGYNPDQAQHEWANFLTKYGHKVDTSQV